MGYSLLFESLFSSEIFFGSVSSVTSDAIPFLKLLIPLATSPIKLEIFPRPNNKTTNITTIAICQIPMLMSIGIWQIAIVVILVVLLFGRGKISSLMGDVAKGIKSFKKGMASDVTDDTEPKNISDENKDSNNKE